MTLYLFVYLFYHSLLDYKLLWGREFFFLIHVCNHRSSKDILHMVSKIINICSRLEQYLDWNERYSVFSVLNCEYNAVSLYWTGFSTGYILIYMECKTANLKPKLPANEATFTCFPF